MRADFGIALDGDADRVVMADEHGHIIDGDQILALIAKSWSKSGALKGGGVVGTVMSNMGLDRYLGGLGLTLGRAQVGDRYVIEMMRKGGFNVGGEQSGHIVLDDFSTTGDGLIAALQVLAVLAEERQARQRGRPSVRAAAAGAGECALQDRRAARGRARASSQSRPARQRLNGKGRVLVRKSGTEPVIRVMAEGEDEKMVRAVVRDLVSAIRDAAA